MVIYSYGQISWRPNRIFWLMSIFIAFMYDLETLRRLGLSVRSSWAAGIALLADHVVLQELGIVLEFFLELGYGVSIGLSMMIFDMHLQCRVHQQVHHRRTLEGKSAIRRTPSDPA